MNNVSKSKFNYPELELTSSELESISGGGDIVAGAKYGSAAGAVFGFCAWVGVSFITGGATLPALVQFVGGGASLGAAAGAGLQALQEE